MEGVGVDIIEIGRIRKSIQSPRFLRRVFSEEEIAEYERRGGRPEILAADFCAKEAFSKAVGTGFRGFAVNDVALIRTPEGAPVLRFSGAAGELVQSRGISCLVSVSHSREYAVAVVTSKEKK